MATKAESIFDRVNTMVEGGMSQAEAFKQIAEEEARPLDSVRGSFYTGRKQREGEHAPRRTRRRETTPEAALEDARASLERSIHAIDAEIEAADGRAREASAEAKELKASAEERKQAIKTRLEALA